MLMILLFSFVFLFQAEDGIRDVAVTGVQTCALPIFEDPSNRMLDTQFDDDSGNLYKPEGGPGGLDQAARWSTSDVTSIERAFDKETNSAAADWSDVIAAIGALHADRSDLAAWRSGLEAVFDVGAFLRCLAISTTMVNWDSYGAMSHNYYVYADPSSEGKLVWFPWDLNEAMLTPVPGATQMSAVMLEGVGADWPLIRFLLDDPTYRQVYRDELRAGIDGAFATARVQ